MIIDSEDELDKEIEEVIVEVCGADETKNMKKHILIIIHIIILIVGCFKCCANTNNIDK